MTRALARCLAVTVALAVTVVARPALAFQSVVGRDSVLDWPADALPPGWVDAWVARADDSSHEVHRFSASAFEHHIRFLADGRPRSLTFWSNPLQSDSSQLVLRAREGDRSYERPLTPAEGSTSDRAFGGLRFVGTTSELEQLRSAVSSSARSRLESARLVSPSMFQQVPCSASSDDRDWIVVGGGNAALEAAALRCAARGGVVVVVGASVGEPLQSLAHGSFAHFGLGGLAWCPSLDVELGDKLDPMRSFPDASQLLRRLWEKESNSLRATRPAAALGLWVCALVTVVALGVWAARKARRGPLLWLVTPAAMGAWGLAVWAVGPHVDEGVRVLASSIVAPTGDGQRVTTVGVQVEGGRSLDVHVAGRVTLHGLELTDQVDGPFSAAHPPTRVVSDEEGAGQLVASLRLRQRAFASLSVGEPTHVEVPVLGGHRGGYWIENPTRQPLSVRFVIAGRHWGAVGDLGPGERRPLTLSKYAEGSDPTVPDEVNTAAWFLGGAGDGVTPYAIVASVAVDGPAVATVPALPLRASAVRVVVGTLAEAP